MKVFGFVLGDKRVRRQQKESFSIEALKHIEVVTSNVDVEVKIHEQPSMEIILHTYEDGPILETLYENDILKINTQKKKSKNTIIGFSFNLLLEIRIPNLAVCNWNIRTGSGNLNMEEIITDTLFIGSNSGDVRIKNVKGDQVDIKTTSGDVMVKRSYAEEIAIHTSSGDMYLKKVTAETIRAKTSSGEVRIRGFIGNIIGNTGSGDIDISLVTNESIDLKAGSGDIKIAVDKKKGSTGIFINTGSGDIVTKLPIEMIKKESKEVIGKIGDGEGAIHIHTGSGDVLLFGKEN